MQFNYTKSCHDLIITMRCVDYFFNHQISFENITCMPKVCKTGVKQCYIISISKNKNKLFSNVDFEVISAQIASYILEDHNVLGSGMQQ